MASTSGCKTEDINRHSLYANTGTLFYPPNPLGWQCDKNGEGSGAVLTVLRAATAALDIGLVSAFFCRAACCPYRRISFI